MKINIRGEKNILTKSLKEQIENKLTKLEKYFQNPDEINVYVNLKINNLSQIIEVTIPTSRYTLRAEEANEDMYSALDLVLDKLERQIRKNKTKLQRIKKETTFSDFNLDFEIEEDESKDNSIIKRKDIEMKPMGEEEAILQIELINHDFFVFKNIDEECVSVIYKRKDNNYGIINVK